MQIGMKKIYIESFSVLRLGLKDLTEEEFPSVSLSIGFMELGHTRKNRITSYICSTERWYWIFFENSLEKIREGV